MITYLVTYIPRGNLAPRACEIQSKTIEANHARHAALKALSFERRTGCRVLTVKECK